MKRQLAVFFLVTLMVLPAISICGATAYTITQLTDNAYLDGHPLINDNGYLVWTGSDGPTTDGEAFLDVPLCECNLAPEAIVISRGGTIGFEATVTNNTDLAGAVLFATKVALPGGSVYPASGFLDGPFNVSLTPHGSKSGHISRTIPSEAPLGIYTYHGYVGNYGTGIYGQCQFYFQVTNDAYNCLACHSGHHSIQHGCSGCHSTSSLHNRHNGVIQCIDCHSLY